jgi:hypothetical protein
MLNRGAPMVEINGLLGHEKLSTTGRFAREPGAATQGVREATHTVNRAKSLQTVPRITLPLMAPCLVFCSHYVGA